MSLATAYSIQSDTARAAEEIAEAFDAIQPALVLYFASPVLDPAALAMAMAARFPDTAVIGSTTAGEITTGKMLKGAVTAMAFDAEHLPDLSVCVVEGLSAGPRLDRAMQVFSAHFGIPVADMDIRQYVGLVLVDGLCGAEERLMEKLGDATNIEFVGGAAGDDLAFDKTWVSLNGRTYTDAAVLALLKPAKPFSVLKTQSFRPTGRELVATRCGTRTVLEFDGKPAVEAYAAALAVAPAEADTKFMSNPVGLMMDGEPYVRSPQQVLDGGIVFYCEVLEGTPLQLLESTDIVSDTRKALEAASDQLGGLTGIVNFNCILRTLQLDASGDAEAYGAVFSDVPTVGFSTYGEEYMGHINQTATMLVFG